MRVDPDEIIEDVLVRRGRRRFPIPWGLFILLGLYFGGVWGFLRYEYYNAPEYKAARHLRIAGQMLGEDNGMTAEASDLLKALDHLLAALSAYPDDPLAHQRIEAVVRRLQERNTKLPGEKQKQIDALALRYRRMNERGSELLIVGPRDLWNVDYALEMPGRIARYSVFGGVIILLIWIYKSWQDRRYLERMVAERMEGRREEIAESSSRRQRRRR